MKERQTGARIVIRVLGLAAAGLLVLALAASTGLLWHRKKALREAQTQEGALPTAQRAAGVLQQRKTEVGTAPEAKAEPAEVPAAKGRAGETAGAKGAGGEAPAAKAESEQAETARRDVEDVPAEVKAYKGVSIEECVARLGPPRQATWYAGPLASPSARVLHIELSVGFDRDGNATGASAWPLSGDRLSEVEQERARSASETSVLPDELQQAFPEWLRAWGQMAADRRVELAERIEKEGTIVGHSLDQCLALFGESFQGEWRRDIYYRGPDRLKGVIPGGWTWVLGFDRTGRVNETRIRPEASSF